MEETSGGRPYLVSWTLEGAVYSGRRVLLIGYGVLGSELLVALEPEVARRLLEDLAAC